MTDRKYYTDNEKSKFFKSYLRELYLDPSKYDQETCKEVVSKLQHLDKTNLDLLFVSKDLTTLKLAATYVLVDKLEFTPFICIDIDSLFNTWLDKDTGFEVDEIKTIPCLIILSFGGSFFKNTKGLYNSIVSKRKFDNLDTITLTTTKDRNLTPSFDSDNIIEFK